jgi:hypothetical protein
MSIAPGDDAAGALIPLLPAGSRGPWALFCDWARAANLTALPATPETIQRFFADCPLAPETELVRIRAIRRAHELLGLIPPYPKADPVRPSPIRTGKGWLPLTTAIAHCPGYGGPADTGRRDAFLLTLLRFGATRFQAGHLRTCDIDVDTWTVHQWHLEPDEDVRTCPRCVLVRWLEVLSAATTDARSEIHAVTLVDVPEGHACALPLRHREWQDAGSLWVRFPKHGPFVMGDLSLRTVTTITHRRQAKGGSRIPWAPSQRRRDPDFDAAKAKRELSDLLDALEVGLDAAGSATDSTLSAVMTEAEEILRQIGRKDT